MSRNNLTCSFILLFSLIFLFLSVSLSQNITTQFRSTVSISRSETENSSTFNYIPKKLGRYSAADWRAVIDSTWGQGDDTSTKLQDFDDFWKRIDEEYPGFYNLDVNWDSLRNVFRPEIEGGVSRGRFYAIISQLFISLMDAHVRMVDLDISRTPLKHGVPLLVPSGYWNVGHFGAALAPTPDSSLFVYRVVENHPLDLKVGDIILGYDGTPWKKLYKELLKIQFPIVAHLGDDYKENYHWSSNKQGIEHTWLTSAGMNWHLFDTLDVVKYITGDTVHLSVAPLEEFDAELYAAGQMPVAGIPFPQIEDLYSAVSCGIIENTNIGYINSYSWYDGDGWFTLKPGSEFTDAIETFMADENIEGIIIDSRLNEGGNAGFLNGLSMLFNENIDILQIDIRADPHDHFAMQWAANHEIRFDNSNFFDKPIAVLTGPLAHSAADMFTWILRSHPMSRSFGLPASGAFGGADWTNPSHWMLWVSRYDLRYRDQEDSYFTHNVFPPDEMLWLQREDVLKGEDTVLKRAMEWINNLAYAHDVHVDKIYVKPNLDTLTITAEVENPNQNDLSVTAILTSFDSTKTYNWQMFNDGNHGDGAAGDSIWGVQRELVEEQTFRLNVKTEDHIAGTSRTLPGVGKFTSIGPVVLDNYTITSSDTLPYPGKRLKFQFTLKNKGLNATAKNVTTTLICLDTCASPVGSVTPEYGDIAPAKTSTGSKSQYILFSYNSPTNINTRFRLDIASNGYTFWSDTFSVFIYPTSVFDEDGKQKIPSEFVLHQNFPNPFNPSTVISYQIPIDSHVELSIYNINGQKVATLVSQQQEAGYYQYKWNAIDLAGGVYLYRLTTDDFVQTKKLIILK